MPVRMRSKQTDYNHTWVSAFPTVSAGGAPLTFMLFPLRDSLTNFVMQPTCERAQLEVSVQGQTGHPLGRQKITEYPTNSCSEFVKFKRAWMIQLPLKALHVRATPKSGQAVGAPTSGGKSVILFRYR